MCDRSTNRRLLVVDDQTVIHDAFRTVFAANGSGCGTLDDVEGALFGVSTFAAPPLMKFHLDHAMQGEEGLRMVEAALAANRPYAVAFVDVRMPPGWDGLVTIERLFEADPNLQVVMCTAYSDYTWSDVHARLGTSDRLLLLKKPFASEEAFQLAVALTEKRRLADVGRQQIAEIEFAYQQLQQEVCERRKAQGELLQAATHDLLTQLPNRALFSEALNESCAKAATAQGPFHAVFFLDIDDFKFVNDIYGHDAGDQLLTQAAERLRRSYRLTDSDLRGPAALPARLGGDEFVMLIRDIGSYLEVEAIAKRLVAAFNQPFVVDGTEISVTASIGVAAITKEASDADEVLRRADVAMYQAKLSGKNQFAVFDSQMHRAVVRRLEIEAALAGAVERSEFRLLYQPIRDASTGRLEGFEALIRWNSTDLGEVGPSEFIPIAEDSRLMVPIGEWVLREACRQLASWQSMGGCTSHLRLSVNVSRKQLARPDFVEGVRSILAEFPAVGPRLNFEITESTVMSNPQVVAVTLAELRAIGICIHMDDFGTGHSSLSCLHQFPLDVLKIDRSFVMTMDSNSEYEAVIQSIITLAHHLNVKVIAEGVESSRQANLLRDLGCEFLQGYHFSTPLSSELATTLIGNCLAEPAGAKASQAAETGVARDLVPLS